jgi:hypothetical protein
MNDGQEDDHGAAFYSKGSALFYSKGAALRGRKDSILSSRCTF